MNTLQLEQRFYPVYDEIDLLLQSEDSVILLGIDGNCGAGKSTLAKSIQEKYDCNLFHMDDFFLQPEQRTEKRLKEPGGNVDYERFLKEVVSRLLKGEEVIYRPYCCKTQTIESVQVIPFKRLNIIEGSYSLHPYFGDIYHKKIFLSIDFEDQVEMIRQREGEEKLKRFVKEWIPKENEYFDTFDIRSGCLEVAWVR